MTETGRFLSVMLLFVSFTSGINGYAQSDAGTPPSIPKERDEAENLIATGQYERAMEHLQRLLLLQETRPNRDELAIAETVNRIGGLYMQKGAPHQAETWVHRALQIRERALGPSNPLVARSLSSLGQVQDEQGHYDEAERNLKRALHILDETPNHDTIDAAATMNALAGIYLRHGAELTAVPMFERAVQEVEKDWVVRDTPRGQQAIGGFLMNAAFAHLNLSNFIEARALIHRAVEVLQRLNPDHPNIAMAKTHLGNIAVQLGEYREAEQFFLDAATRIRRTYGEKSLEAAASYNNLAEAYERLGANDRAEAFLMQGLAIAEKVLGTRHPTVASFKYNLGSLYRDRRGDFVRSEALLRESLTVRQSILGMEHPETAKTMAALGSLYADRSRLEDAESLFTQAVGALERGRGKNHPDLAKLLYTVGRYYLVKRGDLKRAEDNFRRSLAIWESRATSDAPPVADSLRGLAHVAVARGQTAEAVLLLRRAFEISEAYLSRAALTLTDERRSQLLTVVREEQEAIFSLVRLAPANEEARKLAMTALLLRKGRALTETAAVSQAIYQRLAPQDRQHLETLRALTTRYARLAFEGPEEKSESRSQFRAKVEDLKEKIRGLEENLAERSAAVRGHRLLAPDMVLQQVSTALPEYGAFIEVVEFMPVQFGLSPMGEPAPALHYLALGLLPNGTVRTADLGLASRIDAMVATMYGALTDERSTYLPPAQELYDAVLRPILRQLGQRKRLVLSLDGALHMIPMEVLHDAGQHLLDRYEISYATSGRDLLPRSPVERPTTAPLVVILAAPDFMNAPVPAASPSQLVVSVPRSRGLMLGPQSPLPNTKAEALAIAQMFPGTRVLMGREASKQALLAVAQPRVLHVATHGIFAEAGWPGPGETRGLLGPTTQLPEDPLVRSALVLAGANAQGTKPRPQSDVPESGSSISDSLATAIEIAGMNLWGTELVVLSACNTGRGDVVRGQELFGLRRAVLTAGAESLVTSLWKVDDFVTKDLMVSFYHYLLSGQGRAAALRLAAKAIREKHPHPYYWASFTLTGRTEPLARGRW